MEIGVRILILEDNPFIAFDLQALLEREGHQVVGLFESLAQAYAHLDDGFDYALLDIDVVGGKSFGLAIQLAARQIPFAFVSASRPSDLPQSLRQAAFIPKPFEERTILRSIEQVTAGSLTCH
jgi:DNA-binding response OmpR family regulator